jgi:hypothetical protein
MKLRWILAMAAALSLASADTLTLRDGRTVHGSYLGGTARQIRMVVGDSIRTFDVGDVRSIRFDNSMSSAEPAAPAAPAVAPEPAPTPAPPANTAGGAVLPAGTPITIRMIDSVDSDTNQTGQTFRASVDEPVMYNGNIIIPKGADVTTRLVEVKEPGKLAGGGELTLDLSSITVAGQTVDVSSGGVTTTGESRTGQSAKVIGGVAALGAIIGAIAGGGKGAALGGISGAGAGTAIQVLTKGARVRVPSETRLTFTLQHPLQIP